MGAFEMHHSEVEASSLSNVLHVADNPPAKPSLKRTGGDGLTLYIARVPGSRDIFLTTLKPRDKVVTAHDIDSSLYYCHMESEMDELLKEGEESIDGLMAAPLSPNIQSLSFLESQETQTPLQPPPVPPHRELAQDLSLSEALSLSGPETMSAIKRKPVHSNGGSTPPLPPRPEDGDQPTLPPRPNESPQPLNEYRLPRTPLQSAVPPPLSLGPRRSLEPPPLPHRPISLDSPLHLTQKYHIDHREREAEILSESDNLRPDTSCTTDHSTGSFDLSWQRPSSIERPPLSPRSATSSPLTRTSSLSSSLMPRPFSESGLKGFSVTLIRRNPATGDQTNVGKITIPPFTSRYGRPGKALLQLFNPGYAQFRAARGTSTADLVRCISEDDDCTYSCDLRLATRRRSMKGSSTPYFGDVPVNQLIAVTPSQPYSFTSPWNRVCEFSTGVSGRTLKCRHMLARGTLIDENMSDMRVVSLSELRFNTPSSNAFTKVNRGNRRPVGSSSPAAVSSPPPPPPLPPRRPSLRGMPSARSSQDGSRNGSLSANGNSDDPYLDDGGSEAGWDETSPMDLTLGRERAGGGARGNKAKLGKLVIEPEGLEMLDLLVAANMGIWWSVR